MTRRTKIAVLLAAGAAAAGFAAAPAGAAVGPECFGDTHAALCVIVDPSGLPTVNPTGGPGIHDCLFVGPPPCVPVNLPTPSVTPGTGTYVVAIYCAGDAIECTPVIVKVP
jgi:hypothetical protein